MSNQNYPQPNQLPQPMQNHSPAVGGVNAMLPSSQSAGTAIEMSRAVAEVMGLVQIARMNPRHQARAEQRILDACKRRSLAEAARYSYPKGGEVVEGPTIRLAEVLAQNWGNLDFGIKELEQRMGADGTMESIMVSYCWDLETNVRQVKQFTVKHERDKRSGNTKLTSQRDVYELGANMGARRLRACIFGVIPGDILEAAERQCELTLTTNSEPIKDRVRKMVNAFSEQGVTVEMIERHLNHSVESVTEKEILSLQRLYRALKEGFTTPAECFGADDKPAASSVMQSLAQGPAQPASGLGNTVLQPAAPAAPAPEVQAPAPVVAPVTEAPKVEEKAETAKKLTAPLTTKLQYRSAIYEAAKLRGKSEFDVNFAVSEQYNGQGIEDLNLDQLKKLYQDQLT